VSVKNAKLAFIFPPAVKHKRGGIPQCALFPEVMYVIRHYIGSYANRHYIGSYANRHYIGSYANRHYIGSYVIRHYVPRKYNHLKLL
jgi:hypothetical protein